MTMRDGLALALAVVGASALAGCTQTTADPAADPPGWRQQMVQFADAHGPVAVLQR